MSIGDEDEPHASPRASNNGRKGTASKAEKGMPAQTWAKQEVDGACQLAGQEKMGRRLR